jgi:glycosyltransferase involved in cell wall biosynthesis
MVKEPLVGRSAVLTADERKQLEVDLAISADLVAGVGPLLTEMIRDAMRGYHQTPPHVVDIRPGLYDWGGTVNPEDPPGRRQVLLIARAEDVRSKGIDIAVQAVARAVGRFDSDPGDSPVLVVRGVPEGEADVVKQQLDAIVAPQATVFVRPYSADRNSLRRDLWQSRVVIMPSRHEGFGLVSVEAISAGVPVLVSRDSGVGRTLRELVVDGERGEPREVVPVSGDDDEAAQVWGDAIYEQLVDPQSAFKRAADVRQQLDQGMNWSQTVGLLLEGLDLRDTTVDD